MQMDLKLDLSVLEPRLLAAVLEIAALVNKTWPSCYAVVDIDRSFV